MVSKADKLKELDEQYKKHQAEIDAEEDEDGEVPDVEDDEDDDIIILRGNARKQVMEQLKAMGLTDDAAEEVVEEAEEGDPKAEKKVKAAQAKADKVPVSDPKPPPRSRYFGSRKTNE